MRAQLRLDACASASYPPAALRRRSVLTDRAALTPWTPVLHGPRRQFSIELVALLRGGRHAADVAGKPGDKTLDSEAPASPTAPVHQRRVGICPQWSVHAAVDRHGQP